MLADKKIYGEYASFDHGLAYRVDQLQWVLDNASYHISLEECHNIANRQDGEIAPILVVEFSWDGNLRAMRPLHYEIPRQEYLRVQCKVRAAHDIFEQILDQEIELALNKAGAAYKDIEAGVTCWIEMNSLNAEESAFMRDCNPHETLRNNAYSKARKALTGALKEVYMKHCWFPSLEPPVNYHAGYNPPWKEKSCQ